MATATKKQLDNKTADVAEIIVRALASDESLTEAKAKLASLENDLVRSQAELDQVNRASADTADLTSQILSGQQIDIAERERILSQQKALMQNVEAYRLAIARQRENVEFAHAMASEKVLETLKPVHAERTARLIAIIEALDSSVDSWLEIQQKLAQHKVRGALNFSLASVVQKCVREMQASVENHRRFDQKYSG